MSHICSFVNVFALLFFFNFCTHIFLKCTDLYNLCDIFEVAMLMKRSGVISMPSKNKDDVVTSFGSPREVALLNAVYVNPGFCPSNFLLPMLMTILCTAFGC